MSEDQIKAVAKAYMDMLEAAKNKEAVEEMSSKEKMAKGLYNKKEGMDPVGKADADIDNDGDVDKSDEYLHKRRKAIKKNMKTDDQNTEVQEKSCTRKMGESYQGGTIIDIEENRFAVLFDDKVEWIEEAAHDEKAKNIQKKVPEGQEKLEPRAQGEKDFVAKHGEPQVKDGAADEDKSVQDIAKGTPAAKHRPGDKTQSEPMKSVAKTTGQ